MLVSVEEMKAYMGGWNNHSNSAIASIIMGVQQRLEIWLNRPLEYVQIREIVQSDRQGFLYLSVTPVRKIISCGITSAFGTADVPDGILEPYVMSRDPLLPEDARMIDRAVAYSTTHNIVPGGIQGNVAFGWHLVEYIGGYNYGNDEGLKNAIKVVASREIRRWMVDGASHVRGQVDNTEPGDTRLPGWTREELTQLERYRRRIYL